MQLSFMLWRQNGGTRSLRVYTSEPLSNHDDEAMISLHFATVSPLGKTDMIYLCIQSFCPRFVLAFSGKIYENFKLDISFYS
jgi:hypothetical protein